jgi:hypothetical protein
MRGSFDIGKSSTQIINSVKLTEHPLCPAFSSTYSRRISAYSVEGYLGHLLKKPQYGKILLDGPGGLCTEAGMVLGCCEQFTELV